MVAPMKFLHRALDRRISLLLKDGRVLAGKLDGYDDYLNLVLEETEEEMDGGRKRLGTVIVRGNTIVSLSLV